MAFTKETASKAGKLSSRAGSPNKNTAEVREMFKGLLENNFEKLQNDIDQLEPRDRVRLILDMAKFVLPTLKATEITNEGGINPVTITIERKIITAPHDNTDK